MRRLAVNYSSRGKGTASETGPWQAESAAAHEKRPSGEEGLFLVSATCHFYCLGVVEAGGVVVLRGVVVRGAVAPAVGVGAGMPDFRL